MKRISIVIILLLCVFFLPVKVFAAGGKIIIEQGHNQKVQVSRESAIPLEVRVCDEKGKPVAAKVTFEIMQGEGKLSVAEAQTDSEGKARINFTAGFKEGTVIVVAKTDNPFSASVKFYLFITLSDPNKNKIDSKVAAKTSPKPKTIKKSIAPGNTDSKKVSTKNANLKNISIIPGLETKVETLPAAKKPEKKSGSKVSAEKKSENKKTVEKTPVVKTSPNPAVKPIVKTVAKPVAKASPLVKSTPKPSIIIGFGGNNQKIPVGTIAPNKLEVQVMDNGGNPLTGAAVQFDITEGEGTLLPQKTVTDGQGIASVNFAAGKKEGAVTIRARVCNVEDLSTIFYLASYVKAETAKPAVKPVSPPTPKPVVATTPAPSYSSESSSSETTVPIDTDNLQTPSSSVKPRGYYSRNPENISIVGGNYQKATPGARLSQPIVVYVTDGDGNPVDCTVEFTVLGGNAKIINKQVKTDARGLAGTFVVVNSLNSVRIVAEVLEKPGLSTIAYANADKPGNSSSGGGDNSTNPVIKSSVPTNQPGYPAAIAFYSVRMQNTDSIEKTKVVPLEIGVTDFRSQPVQSNVKFTVIKGSVSILNPLVQTNAEGRGICYVDIGNSMGIFTIEAQSLENPDLKAVFKSGPEVRTKPSADSNAVTENYENPSAGGSDSSAVSGSEPALIAVLNGGGQKGKIGEILPQPLEVLVTDNMGAPISGLRISFSAASGQAKFQNSKVTTGSNGRASTYVTMGKYPGEIEVKVIAHGKRKLQTIIHLEATR